MTESEVQRIVHARPPRCLASLSLERRSNLGNEDLPDIVKFFVWNNKSRSCKVYGYDLLDYNPEHKTPLTFIAPITLEFPDGERHIVFDSDIHGFDGESQSSTNYRGEGPAQPYRCLKCGRQSFEVCVEFDFHEDTLDEFPKAEVPDNFTEIEISGKCDQCGHVNTILAQGA